MDCPPGQSSGIGAEKTLYLGGVDEEGIRLRRSGVSLVNSPDIANRVPYVHCYTSSSVTPLWTWNYENTINAGTKVAIDREGTVVVVAIYNNNTGMIDLFTFDPADGTKLNSHSFAGGYLRGFDLSADGSTLYLHENGTNVHIIDVATQSSILPVENAYYANFQTYSADDAYVLSVYQGVLTLRDGGNGAAIETLPHTSVTYPDWSLEGSMVAFARVTRDFFGDWTFYGGQIEVMTYDGPGTWGEPQVLVPAETSINSGSYCKAMGRSILSKMSTYSPSPWPGESGTLTVNPFPLPLPISWNAPVPG